MGNGSTVGTGQYELSADRTQLQKDLAAAKQDVQASGDTAQKSYAAAFASSPAIKEGFKQVGEYAKQGFESVTTGAEEAESAQNSFMKATGASRDEAKQFVSGMDSLAGSAGAVGMSFNDIADAGVTVSQQFGVTGQDAVDLTGKVLAFSKVTGQDANTSATTLKDTLSAFNLTTADAGPLMDQLSASQQKFGINVGEALPALQDMAPALQAMGMNASDGVAALDLLKQSGLNASDAAGALNRAVKNLKPGQDLNDLITQIGSIDDPAKRAQEAVRIFGRGAGVGLANAIKPGMTSLDDVKQSLGDVTDATQKTADSLETPAEKIQGAFDKMMAGAREVGQQFGPALTGLSALQDLAGPLVSGAKSLFSKIAGDAGLLGGATAVGAAEGGAEAEGATGASVLSGWLGKFGLMTPEKIAAATAAGESEGAAEGAAAAGAMKGPGALAAAGSAGTALAVAAAGAAAIWFASRGINDIFGGPGSQTGYENAAKDAVGNFAAGLDDNLRGPFVDQVMAAYNDGIQKGLDPQAALAQAQAIGQQFLAGTVYEHDSFSAAGTAAAQVFGDAFDHDAHTSVSATAASLGPVFEHDSRPPLIAGSTAAAKAAADALANKQIWDASAMSITGDLAGTLKQGAETDIKTAMDKVTWAIDHPLALEHQKSEIEAALSSKKLATALASSNPEISTTAQQQQQYLIGLWQNLTRQAWTQGGQTSTNLDNSLSSKYPDIRSNARGLVGDVNQIFDALKTNYNVSVAYHAGQIAKNDLPRFAEGGYAPADKYFLAGEQGPEILKFDTGASVMPAGATREWRSAFNSSATPTEGEVHYHTHTHFQIAGNVIGDRAGLAALGQAIDDARGLSQRTRPPLGGAFGN